MKSWFWWRNQWPLNKILIQMTWSLPYLFNYSVKSRTHTPLAMHTHRYVRHDWTNAKTTFVQCSINVASVVKTEKFVKCYIAVKEISNKPFIRIPCQLWSLYLKREIAGLKGPKNQTKRTITAWKNFQVMRDLKDFDCLPKRKQINEVMIEVHKTTSGLEIGNFHSPRFLTQAQEGIQWNPQEKNDGCNEKVILSSNTLLNWGIS